MADDTEALDAIDAKIEKIVVIKDTQFGDQRTVFREADDILKLRGHVARRSGQTRSFRLAATSKGV